MTETNFAMYSYGFSNTYQIQVDYIHSRIILLPSPTGNSFHIFDLTTNGTTTVNLTSIISGGTALDLNLGRIYVATQNGIFSCDPITLNIATVYTNTDLLFRGMTIDSKNGLMFFIADQMSKKDSQLFVLSMNLPLGTSSGTPTPLQITTPATFATVALAHCNSTICGKCGYTLYAPTTSPSKTNAAITLTSSVFFLLSAFLTMYMLQW